MDKKQTLLLGLMALGVGAAGPVSATEALDGLNVEAVIENRAKCVPYGECEPSKEIQLSPSEEAQIQRNLAVLNALNVITVVGLTKTEAPVSGYCYGLPCPEDMEQARAKKRAKAATLAHIVETVSR